MRRRVTIAYDGMSAIEAKTCLNANGIKTYIFDSPSNTEIVLTVGTALHSRNCHAAKPQSREYNGYKVYWEDGAQITPPHDKNILAEVARILEFSSVKDHGKRRSSQETGLFPCDRCIFR